MITESWKKTQLELRKVKKEGETFPDIPDNYYRTYLISKIFKLCSLRDMSGHLSL